MEMFGMTGERLGMIGQSADGEPDWKRALLSKPSVSIRKGIAYGYDPPQEKTSTLVLTAGSGKFVDIRFSLAPNSPTSDDAFWAFAGLSTTTFPGDQDGWPYVAHCVWEHYVDSKGADDADEGDLYLLGNGDVMEVGISEDAVGKAAMYKEYWTSPEGTSVGPCLVAETRATGGATERVRGMMVRIGEKCQGIVENTEGKGVFVERWNKDAGHKSSDDAAKWIKDWRSNTEELEQVDVQLPCMWLCGEARKKGDEIVVAGRKWVVVETSN